MKTTLVIVLLLSAHSPLFSQASLQVTVKDIKEQKGTIRIGLFANERDFLKNAAYGKVVRVAGSEVTVTFTDLPPGEYGLSVIHDENDNQQLDTNVIGVPTEGFAFGNNAMGAFGPPSFEKAKVNVLTAADQTIFLKYF